MPLSEREHAGHPRENDRVVAVSGMLQGSGPVVRGNRKLEHEFVGVHDQYNVVRDWPVINGREFTPNETRTAARVALLGTTVVEKLFGTSEPVGQTIRVKNVPFQVVGVLESKGQNSFGRDQDDVVMLPMSAARGRIVGRSQVINDSVGTIYVKFAPDVSLTEAKSR